MSVNNIEIIKKQNNSFANKLYYGIRSLLIFLLLFRQADAFILKRNFTFCDVTGPMALLDNRVDCNNPTMDWQSLSNGSFMVLSKMHDKINGDGWQCNIANVTNMVSMRTYFLSDQNQVV